MPARTAPRPRTPGVEALAHAIESWFDANARDLPWRLTTSVIDGVPRRDPYRSLVSELMLQQTQVARVVERFVQFMECFPSVHALAAADVADVLALWSGLGYYRRARLLHAAAQHVVREHAGVFPSEIALLRKIPGVGPYTAGAVASMALGQRVPLVDANVARVLVRLRLPEVADRPTGDPVAHAWAWEEANRLVEQASIPGALNEGLMELGALVCTPAAPRCDACPLAAWCAARAAGRQESVPAPKKSVRRGSIYASSVLIKDRSGRVLVHQRDARGMWAGLWQAPTLERPDRFATQAQVRAWLATLLGTSLPNGSGLAQVGSFEHPTTHREVRFRVWTARWVPNALPAGFRWAGPSDMDALGLSSAQRKVLSLDAAATSVARASRLPPGR